MKNEMKKMCAAEEQYHKKLDEVKNAINKLNKVLELHEERMSADPTNYGFLGDMSATLDNLNKMHLMNNEEVA